MRAARSARSRAARSATRRSAASSPSTCARRTAASPWSGALLRSSMSHAARRSSSTACARARSASRRARSASSRVASAACTAAGGGLDGGQRALLGLHGALGLAHERVAAVALGQHALRAAARRLAQLAREAEPRAAGARDGHAQEAGRQLIEVLDHPRVGQQPARELHRGRRPGDHVAQVARPRRRRRRARAPRPARPSRRPARDRRRSRRFSSRARAAARSSTTAALSRPPSPAASASS